MATKPKSAAPFSAHARGVPLFDRRRFFNVPSHLARLLLDLRDISSSIFWFLSTQTWLTLWSALITLFSVTFFSFYNDRSLNAPLDWSHILSATLLPLVIFTWAAYNRRERCLDELSKVKILLISIHAAFRDWVPSQQQQQQHTSDFHNSINAQLLSHVQDAITQIINSMHTYFLPSRFYTREYPYFGFRSTLVQIALDRARHRAQMRAACTQLSATILDASNRPSSSSPSSPTARPLLPPHLESQLHSWVLELQISIDKMGNVKEYRTPQGMRSLARFYVVLFIPIFFGPYWAWVATNTDFAFAFFFSILTQVALTAVLNLSLALEDPFDNKGMDGVFVDEPLYEVELEMRSEQQPGVVMMGDKEGVGTTTGGATTDGGTGVPMNTIASSPLLKVGNPSHSDARIEEGRGGGVVD